MTLAIIAKLSVLDSSGGLGYASELHIWDRALTTKYFSTIFPRNTPCVFHVERRGNVKYTWWVCKVFG